MKLSALAALKDLRRSQGLMALGKNGKLQVRSIKAPAKGGIQSKIVVRMNGLGEAGAGSLIREAEVACKYLLNAARDFTQKKYHAALDSYFKASAIASNVLFTSSTHGIDIPRQVKADMSKVIEDGTLGIKRVMKVIAVRTVRKHVRKMHKGSK